MNANAAALLARLDSFRRHPGDAWERVRALLEQQADSAFGRAHGFASIRTQEEFREAIPVADYESHRHWIQRAASGESGVLGGGEPVGFERTSGTSAESKWIPITEGLKREFAQGLAGWFAGWRRRCPAVYDGRAYWVISPPGRPSETSEGGLPIGMDGDGAYFPAEIGESLASWLVMPELGGDPAAVFEETAEAMLSTGDLSLVSAWSPTFLLGIDAALRLRRGNRSWREIWPRLALVSCWADASSAAWIPLLRERLGGIRIEPKGLLATEGVTSLPDEIDGSPRLAAECHYHEFLDLDGQSVMPAALRVGGVYEVLLTTSGGLFRYRSGDRVVITGVGGDGLPRMRFSGRSGMVSDLVGEKLHEEQVLNALLSCGTRGLLMADAGTNSYVAWLEDIEQSAAFERLLRLNPYFDHALALGQLGPVRFKKLADDWSLKLAASLAVSRGCRCGDVKLPVLWRDAKAEEVERWLG